MATAEEAQVSFNMTIRKTSGNLVLIDEKISRSYRATVTGTKGPAIGALTIPTTGKLIYLSPEIVTPGLCVMENQDPTNYVEIGIFDPQTNVAYPLLELLPGESLPCRLSRNLQEQYAGSGTGTTGPENYLWMKANKASVVVGIKLFEK